MYVSCKFFYCIIKMCLFYACRWGVSAFDENPMTFEYNPTLSRRSCVTRFDSISITCPRTRNSGRLHRQWAQGIISLFWYIEAFAMSIVLAIAGIALFGSPYATRGGETKLSGTAKSEAGDVLSDHILFPDCYVWLVAPIGAAAGPGRFPYWFIPPSKLTTTWRKQHVLGISYSFFFSKCSPWYIYVRFITSRRSFVKTSSVLQE